MAHRASSGRRQLIHVRYRPSVGAFLSASLLFACLPGCSLTPWLSRDIGLTYPEINERLNRRFPLERNIADLVRVTLFRPLVAPITDASLAAPARLAVTFDLDMKLPSLLNSTQRSLWGTMRLSGVPRFDPPSNSVVLQDARIDRVRVENMPDALSAALSKTASQLAKEYLEEKPLYTLTAEQATRLRATTTAPTIEVRSDRLSLVFK